MITRRVGIEKRHSGFNKTIEHLIMQMYRGVHTERYVCHTPEDNDYDRKNDYNCVHNHTDLTKI